MEQLLKLLSDGKTQFHVVEACKSILSDNGFEELAYEDSRELVPGGKYMLSPFRSMLFAWTMGAKNSPLRIACAHTDFPMLKIKSNPEITKKGYVQVNVEPYGGLLSKTWFDRPLGMAGKVVLSGDNPFAPKVKLFDSQKPLFMIPNLAPHLERDKTKELDVQKELIPILSCTSSLDASEITNGHVTEGFLLRYLAGNLDVSVESILDYDLYLYISGAPEQVGLKDEFLAAARIDNTSSVSAILEAITQNSNQNITAVAALFDNEEIGSRSKQGADSMLLRELLERICPGRQLGANSFNLSVDVAHATHPNYIEKNDITNDIILGNGVVLKSSASQRYVTDSEAGAVIAALCRQNDIPFQRQVNRSGMPGGQTLGPIMSSYLPIRSADIGIPILAMHSACELAHKTDYESLVKLLTAYYHEA
ncbi:MAG: M18 family aminopeptidase [Lachnospiraceae bacterium]|nr:M18 family aminopeptidase [Lachnospiraceae bacterium]